MSFLKERWQEHPSGSDYIHSVVKDTFTNHDYIVRYLQVLRDGCRKKNGKGDWSEGTAGADISLGHPGTFGSVRSSAPKEVN